MWVLNSCERYIRYSELLEVIERVRQFEFSTSDITHIFGANFQTLIEESNDVSDDELTHRISFTPSSFIMKTPI